MGYDTFATACEAVSEQLALQLDGMDLELVRTLPHYKFILKDKREGDQAREITARCLPDTWSLYEQRFFQVARTVDLLIVQSHNAVAPVAVLCLEDGVYYRAATCPALERSSFTRRNEQEKHLLISMLALGLEAGEKALEALSPRSRKRYREELQDLLKKRPGRNRLL